MPADNPFESSSSALQVCAATDADADAWDAAVDRLAGGSFYHRFAWRAINRDALGSEPHYLVAREHGAVVGVLPLALVASPFFGRILCSVPFVNFGGPCAAHAAARAALLAEARRLGEALRADRVELRCWEPADCGVQPSLHKVSMVVPLPGDADALQASFSPKHRKNLRRARKEGVEVVCGGAELLGEFYAVLARAWRDLGTPLYAPNYFERIVEAMPGATRIFLCRHGGQSIAAAFNGYACGRGEGLWNGGLPESRRLHANYVLYWELLNDACRRGLAAFNLGRSTADSGSEDFKHKWNAERHQLYWYAWSPRGRAMPDLSVTNPRFRLAIAAWRRLPLALARRLGPPLARGIP